MRLVVAPWLKGVCQEGGLRKLSELTSFPLLTT